MSVSGMAGPLIVYGQNPAQATTAYQPDYNGDQAPSAFAQGSLLLDGRYGFRAPMQAGTLTAIGHYEGADLMLVDEVPATKAVAALAAAQNVTNGTAMTLVSSAGAGIVLATAGFVFPQSGTALATAALCINSMPSLIYFGQNKSVACVDPRTSISRAVSITGSASATGGNFLVRGLDLYGYPTAEMITATAGATTTNGTRAFKVVTAVVPQITDAHNYSVGTTDIIGMPMMVTNFAQAYIVYGAPGSQNVITASTGFVAGATTQPVGGTPATGTTGDVRGTYALQSAANNTNMLQVFVSPAPWNVGSVNGAASLYGFAQPFA